VLRATNIQDARLVLESDLVYVTASNVSPDQRLRAGDIVIATSSGSKHLVGKSALLHGDWDGSFGAFCAGIRPKANIDPRYLAYFLQSPRYWKEIGKKAIGVNINNLRRGDLETLLLPLPSVAEQREIVAEVEKQFSRLDEAVANLKRGKANLRRYKAAVLRAAVEGRLVPTEADLALGEARAFESGRDLLARILESCKSKTVDSLRQIEPIKFRGTALTPLPDGWVWATCDQLLAGIEAGASFKCVERPPLSGETGVLKVSAVTWGAFDEEESKTCVDLGRVREEFLVKTGDFLFSRANTVELVGACVIVRSATKRLMLSDKTLRFRLRPLVLPEWLLACLRSEHGRREITRLATGNQESMRNIGQDRIRRIRIPMPPLAEQRRILAELDCRLSTIDALGKAVSDAFSRVQHLRQAALAKHYGAVAGEMV